MYEAGRKTGGDAGRAVVDADGYRTVPPSESQRSCAAALCVRIPFSQADDEQAIDGRVVVRRRRGHQGGMCAVRVGVGRDYQQNDPAAVESEDFDGVWRLESDPSSRTARPPVASLVGAFASR